MPNQPKDSIESSHFSPDTLEFIRLLQAHQARYVVVGGEAVIYHGYPRFTGDIDFFFSDAPDNVEAVFAALREFWGGSVPGIESAEELAEPGVIIQFGRPPNRIDLLNRIDGVNFQEAWNDRVELRVSCPAREVSLLMIDFRNLLRNKRAASRPKDLDDLRALET
jgi:hypothetical protein